jgi:nitroimidazol reductase NimA-like FMN-containing flavoprotein (pyridoxamine 5'-phosphate oxidase superfamily)
MAREPVTELHPGFSSPGASATDWAEARERLERAEIYWVTTVRPDGRPHVTPLVAAWLDDALYFSTGESERKAKNLASNRHVVMTTGCNAFRQGFDLVVEGEAAEVSDEPTLRRVADAFVSKYDWHFEVRNGAFYETRGPDPREESRSDSRVLVYRVTPTKVFGYGRGEFFSAIRWRF